MSVILWKTASGILFLVCLSLGIRLILFRQQMKSICRQLRIHRTEDSNADIWLDIVKTPFHELQKELNDTIKKQREERKKYREQEQAFREFVSNVSHDIRTPITAVSGYFQLILDTEDEAKRGQYARIITGRLRDFQAMLEDFYAYATVTVGDRKTEMEKCNVTRLVSESLFLYYQEIEAEFGVPTLLFPEKEIFCICFGTRTQTGNPELNRECAASWLRQPYGGG